MKNLFTSDKSCGLNENTLISTISGLKKIKDLRNGITIYTESGKEKIAQIVKNNLQNTKIITVNNGIEIESTLNHSFRCWDGDNIVWKNCEELKEDDVLIKRKLVNLNTHGRDTPDIKYNKKGKDIKIKFDENFAYLLGWLVGGGNTTSNDRITFYYGSDLEKEHIYKNLLKCFPKEEIKNYKYQDDRFYILSKYLLNSLDEIGVCFKTSRFKRIPITILKSTDNIKYAFLAGLFDADGNISDNKGRDGEYLSVSLVTTSNILSQEISILLYSLGIQSYIDYRKESKEHYRKDGCFIKSSDGYAVRIIGLYSIRKFLKKGGFKLSYKKNKYQNKEFPKKWNYNDAVSYNISKILKPLLLLNTYKNDRYFENYTNKNSLQVDRWYFKENLTEILDIYAEYKSTKEYEKVENIVKNFEFFKIKNIKESSCNIFNIYLNNNDSFIANGFIVK